MAQIYWSSILICKAITTYGIIYVGKIELMCFQNGVKKLNPNLSTVLLNLPFLFQLKGISRCYKPTEGSSFHEAQSSICPLSWGFRCYSNSLYVSLKEKSTWFNRKRGNKATNPPHQNVKQRHRAKREKLSENNGVWEWPRQLPDTTVANFK